MHVAVMFSGGKDSVLCASILTSQGFDISLLTIHPEEYSMMFHHQNVEWTKLQAEAIGLKHTLIECTDKNWEEYVKDTLRMLDVDAIGTGAYASEYQRRKIDFIAEELGIPNFSPLWHRNVHKEMVDYYDIIITGVSAEGLTKEYLGKKYLSVIDIVGPSLEGGEAETFVLDAPLFRKRIKVEKAHVLWDGIRGSYIIDKARLVNK